MDDPGASTDDATAQQSGKDPASAGNESKAYLLDCLTVEAGPGSFLVPARRSRKQVLLDLVPNLTLDERWMLLLRLTNLDLRNDLLTKFPTELQFMLTEYLAPADIGWCLLVSRAWRSILLHDSIRKTLSRRCFPGQLAYEAAAATVTAPSVTPENIFIDATHKYTIQAQGRFRWVFRHCPVPVLSVVQRPNGRPKTTQLYWLPHPTEQRGEDDDSGDDAKEPPHDDTTVTNAAPYRPWPTLGYVTFGGPDYAHGRLAWQSMTVDGTWHMVDDLRDGRRQTCKLQQNVLRGEIYCRCAFGDELLVSSAGLRLHAWSFATGEEFVTRLPMQARTVATRGRRVCIWSAGSLYVWNVGNGVDGGSLHEVDTSGLDRRHCQPDQDGRLRSYLILDAVRADVFFLGNYELESDDGSRSGDLCFYVHRFVGLRYCQTFTHRQPFANGALPAALISAMQPRSARGLYSLAAWRVYVPFGSAGSSFSVDGGHGLGLLVRPVADTIRVKAIGAVSFNIYTHTFTTSFFHLPPSVPQPGHGPIRVMNVHLWNDQLVTMVDRHRQGPPPGGKVRRALPLLCAFDDCQSEAARSFPPEPFSAVRLYTSRPWAPWATWVAASEATLTRPTTPTISSLTISTTSTKSPTPLAAYNDDDDDDDDDDDGKSFDGDLLRLARPPPQKPPIPQQRQALRINELAPGRPGQWAQNDDDWRTNRCLLRYALDLDVPSPAPDATLPGHIDLHAVQGDDDFLLFHHDNEYTVWSFGEDVVGHVLQRVEAEGKTT